MTSRPRPGGSWMRRVALSAVLVAAAGALAPSAAAETYAAQPWTACQATVSSGSWDNAGRLYIPCGSPTTIKVFNNAGTQVRRIETNLQVSDVAPSPTGDRLYLARGRQTPLRMNRRADGSYALDKSWRLSRYSYYGDPKTPSGHFISTDGQGAIYLADGGGGANLTHVVIKYGAGGRVLTQFGDFGNTWNPETFYNLHGIVATRDGAHVYTVEGNNSRVMRWDRQADGTYAVATNWRIGNDAASDPNRTGGCWLTQQKLASPYDVALDGYGFLYILNTTCDEVLKFEQDRTFVTGTDLGTSLPHGFSVAANGARVYVPQSKKLLRRVP